MDGDPDEAPNDEGAVLSPDELDITAEDAVVEIEEGRYVISPSGEEPRVSNLEASDGEAPAVDRPSRDRSISGEAAHGALAHRLRAADAKFGFDITARFEGTVSQRELFSNDVVTTFENLVVWYATQAGSDTPIEDVLGILLLESNLTVRFPADSLRAFVEAQGLEPEDSVEALLAATREAGGIRFPPED